MNSTFVRRRMENICLEFQTSAERSEHLSGFLKQQFSKFENCNILTDKLLSLLAIALVTEWELLRTVGYDEEALSSCNIITAGIYLMLIGVDE